MGIHSVYYWLWVALSLYASYLVCFCLYMIDDDGNKTEQRIPLPRICYLLGFAGSFIPLWNIIFGCTVMAVAIIAYFTEEGFYFKTWLLDKPKDKKTKKE